jgi:hypothetical protein
MFAWSCDSALALNNWFNMSSVSPVHQSGGRLARGDDAGEVGVDGFLPCLGGRAGVGDLPTGGFQAASGDGGDQPDVFLGWSPCRRENRPQQDFPDGARSKGTRTDGQQRACEGLRAWRLRVKLGA